MILQMYKSHIVGKTNKIKIKKRNCPRKKLIISIAGNKNKIITIKINKLKINSVFYQVPKN